MKQYQVDIDITVTKRVYVDAESEEQARQIVKARLDENPYYDAKTMDAVIGFEIIETSLFVPEDPADELDKHSLDFKAALLYARGNMEPFELDIIRDKVKRNCSQNLLPSTGLSDHRIIDLLEEYGSKHGLGEGWYLDEYDDDEVMLLI